MVSRSPRSVTFEKWLKKKKQKPPRSVCEPKVPIHKSPPHENPKNQIIRIGIRWLTTNYQTDLTHSRDILSYVGGAVGRAYADTHSVATAAAGRRSRIVRNRRRVAGAECRRAQDAQHPSSAWTDVYVPTSLQPNTTGPAEALLSHTSSSFAPRYLHVLFFFCFCFWFYFFSYFVCRLFLFCCCFSGFTASDLIRGWNPVRLLGIIGKKFDFFFERPIFKADFFLYE